MMKLEKMADFFARRADMYDEHMLTEVEGCREGYEKMASLVPSDTQTLLDLGCGTGLELDGIFRRCPDIRVTGIDLSDVMLGRLREKYEGKRLSLICGDYFQTDLGKSAFDCAVSFQTMHHFPQDKKLSLYKKINAALKEEGIYIECDYMVEMQEEEVLWFAEKERLFKENGISGEDYYHYDTPCTVSNQISLMKKAGFRKVTQVFRIENTTMLIAEK